MEESLIVTASTSLRDYFHRISSLSNALIWQTIATKLQSKPLEKRELETGTKNLTHNHSGTLIQNPNDSATCNLGKFAFQQLADQNHTKEGNSQKDACGMYVVCNDLVTSM